jgi:hypothetical protein
MVWVEAFDNDNDSDSDSQPIGTKELLMRRAYAYDVCEVGEERRMVDGGWVILDGRVGNHSLGCCSEGLG